jgi:L-lysine 6-transaminase
MVRSTHYLRIMEQERLVENARSLGAFFLDGLQKLATQEPLITAPRGRGLMLAFDLPDKARRDPFYVGLFELGLLAVRCGERSIRFRPALDISSDAIQSALMRLREQCRRMRSTLSRPRLEPTGEPLLDVRGTFNAS